MLESDSDSQFAAAAHPRLAALALDPDRLSIRRLWTALGSERRENAAKAFLGSAQHEHARHGAISEIARARSFRPQTIASWDNSKLATTIARIELRDSRWAWHAIAEDLVANHAAMLTAFLDQLGIAHTAGRIDAEALTDDSIPVADVFRAADVIATQFNADDVIIYLLALRIENEGPFEHVSAWLDLHLKIGTPAALASASIVPKQLGQPEPTASPITADGFTKLDLRLIRLVVDCAAAIEGAPSADEIDDIISEVEQLNSGRHRTLFHRGFRDSVLDRPAVDELAAENSSRRRWYWAGYINGLARRGMWRTISDLFTTHNSISELGQLADGASEISLWLVFRALSDAARYAEAAGIAGRDIVDASPALRRSMFVTATNLVRNSRAAEARPLLDALWAARAADNSDADEEEDFWLQVKRRRALCLRQLGEHAEAKVLLEELAKSSNLTIRAVALTDLGLLAAGKRRLGDISLPVQEAERRDFETSLAQGEALFRQAISDPTFQPAHAQYALGLLELSRGNYDEAALRLDVALSFFNRNPTLYRADGALAIAELSLGVAICLSMDPARLPRACELIRSGLDGGAKLPNWLIKSTIDSLSIGSSDLGVSLATELIKRDPNTLSALIASEAGHATPALTNALFARAALPSRSAPDRARDYLQSLPLLLRDGSVERAADALSYLEERASEGILTSEFIDLLADVKRYSPAWTVDRAEEARIRLLESQGRLEEAAQILAQLCWRILGRGGDYALDEATLIVGHLESYGPPGSSVAEKLSATIDARLAVLAPDHADMSSDASKPVRILVVGGNEVQARMDASIQARVEPELVNVEVGFLHSGWGGDWTRYSNEFDRLVRSADGVVLLALMRTTLGWTIRHDCPVPWRGCRGSGQGQIFETIKRCAQFARNRLEKIGVEPTIVG